MSSAKCVIPFLLPFTDNGELVALIAVAGFLGSTVPKFYDSSGACFECTIASSSA